jgi:hypothetical protein
MFGFFKKPDSKKTVNECLEVWDILTEKDRLSSAQNILKIADYLNQQCKSGSDALLTIGALKQEVIGKYVLRDHIHPAYMQVQILSDYIYSRGQSIADHTYARFALEKITDNLTIDQKRELISKLGKFL